jgi:hypothetical protein
LTETVDNALGLAGQAVQLSSDERERISALTALGDDCRLHFVVTMADVTTKQCCGSPVATPLSLRSGPGCAPSWRT